MQARTERDMDTNNPRFEHRRLRKLIYFHWSFMRCFQQHRATEEGAPRSKITLDEDIVLVQEINAVKMHLEGRNDVKDKY